MDDRKQEFVPLKETATEELAHKNPVAQIVSIGDTFEFKNRKFRVRKITKKDIVCRPLNWDQDKEGEE